MAGESRIDACLVRHLPWLFFFLSTNASSADAMLPRGASAGSQGPKVVDSPLSVRGGTAGGGRWRGPSSQEGMWRRVVTVGWGLVTVGLACSTLVPTPCALFHGVQHNSLFAAGVRAISGGPWVAQNCVEIVTEDGTVVARGLVNYSSQEVERIRFVASHYAGCRLVSEWWLGGDVVSLSPPPTFPPFWFA